MSAFIVSKEHIDAIITYAIDNKISVYSISKKTRLYLTQIENANFVGQTLYTENFRSVNHRYRENEQVETYLFTRYKGTLTLTFPIFVKLLHCLEYQSCEHEEWETSEAKHFISEFISSGCRELPGYEEAPWGL